MSSDRALRPWLEVLEPVLGGATRIDVHTHIGHNDPDGFTGGVDELVAGLELAGARAVVFPMHEPQGYAEANDRAIAAAREHPERLTAFCRVDPHDAPVTEAERALAAGARGVKLHPRAEGFELSHPAVAEVAAACSERGAPLLVHAGRGIPALGRDALELCERLPGAPIILAHAGISDIAWLHAHAADHPSLLYDTSWWNPVDLLALFALLPPARILFASDAPYGTPIVGAIATLRCALQAGLSGPQVESVMGGQAERLLAWRPPAEVGPAAGEAALSHDVLLERVYAALAVALGRLLGGYEADEQLALARLACAVGDEAPQAAACRSVLALLDIHDRISAASAEERWRALHLVTVALAVAKTPDVALPEPAAATDVRAREQGAE